MQKLLFSFEGRVNRAKFWLVVLGIAVVQAVIYGAALGGAAASGDPEQAMNAVGPVMGLVLLAVSIVFIWISLANAVKRFHDRNKSGWWILIVLVPVIGGLWYLIECGFLRGTAGPNTYGPDPLAAG